MQQSLVTPVTTDLITGNITFPGQGYGPSKLPIFMCDITK